MAGVIVNDNNKFLERVVAFVVTLTLLRLDMHELSGIYWYLNFKKKKIDRFSPFFFQRIVIWNASVKYIYTHVEGTLKV